MTDKTPSAPKGTGPNGSAPCGARRRTALPGGTVNVRRVFPRRLDHPATIGSDGRVARHD